MVKLRISATQLDKWRKFRQFEWYTEDKLIEDLFGEFMPTSQMEIGTACHALIDDIIGGKNLDWQLFESLDDNYVGMVYSKNGWKFDAPSIVQVFDHIPTSPFSLRESKKVTNISIGNYDIELVAVPDLIFGTTAYDFKTVWKMLDGEDIQQYYIDSMQWKVYLLAYHITQFRYIFIGLDKTQHDDIVSIKDVDSVSCYAYPTMFREMIDLLEDFGQWIEHRNYSDKFQQKGVLVI